MKKRIIVILAILVILIVIVIVKINKKDENKQERIDVSEMEIPTIIYNFEKDNAYSGLSLAKDFETPKDMHIFIKNNDFKIQVAVVDDGIVKECESGGYYLEGDGTYKVSMLDPNGDKVEIEDITVTIKKVPPVYSVEGTTLKFDPDTIRKIELINLYEEDVTVVTLEKEIELKKGEYKLEANSYYDVTFYGSDEESVSHDNIET